MTFEKNVEESESSNSTYVNFIGNFLADPKIKTALQQILQRIHKRAPDVIDIDDLHQETLCRAIQCADQFRGGSNEEFLGWLHSIAHSFLMDSLRARQRDRLLLGKLKKEIAHKDNDNALSTLIHREQYERILNRLPHLDRAVLKARYEEDLSFDEIGLIIGQSAANARQKHHRLLEYIKSELAASNFSRNTSS